MGSRYWERGAWYTEPGKRWVPKTKLELAAEKRDIALQNLVAASEALGKAQAAYREAQEEKPCNTCKWGPK